MSVADNVKAVRERIEKASQCGVLSGGKVTLVAASKTMPVQTIRLAALAGVDAIAENRAQEFFEKHSQGAFEGVQAHFIGHLQKNKAKLITGTADLIQSVDSIELLRLISRLAVNRNTVQDVLLQVNLEASKNGASPDIIPDLCAVVTELPAIRVRGLMTIPPVDVEPSVNRDYFSRMYKLFVDIRAKKYDNVSMDYLSMGMSSDFEDAIIEGANMVRVGTAIFGRR